MIAVDPSYDITECYENGRWVKLDKFPRIPSREKVTDHQLTVANNELYIAGGVYLENFMMVNDMLDAFYVDDFYQYDRLDNQWSPLCPMMTERSCFAMVHMNDHIYAIGGKGWLDRRQFKILDEVECYSLQTGFWEVVANLPVSLSAPSAVVYKDNILVYGVLGMEDYDLRTVDASLLAYDPQGDTWTQLLTEVVQNPFRESSEKVKNYPLVLVVENNVCYRVKYVDNVAQVNRLTLQLDNTAPYTGQLCSPHNPSDQTTLAVSRDAGPFCINKRIFVNLRGYVHRLDINVDTQVNADGVAGGCGWERINCIDSCAAACATFTFDKYCGL